MHKIHGEKKEKTNKKNLLTKKTADIKAKTKERENLENKENPENPKNNRLKNRPKLKMMDSLP